MSREVKRIPIKPGRDLVFQQLRRNEHLKGVLSGQHGRQVFCSRACKEHIGVRKRFPHHQPGLGFERLKPNGDQVAWCSAYIVHSPYDLIQADTGMRDSISGKGQAKGPEGVDPGA